MNFIQILIFETFKYYLKQYFNFFENFCTTYLRNISGDSNFCYLKKKPSFYYKLFNSFLKKNY